MAENYLCVSIPAELQCYQKLTDLISNDDLLEEKADFGVKFIKDDSGNLKFAAYYSDIGELIKKIYYEGSSISLIEHYRNNILYSGEKYHEGKISRKNKYSRQGQVVCSLSYEYDKTGQIKAIRKQADDMRYIVEYCYDELNRVNGRTIRVNGKIFIEQKYRYDILDRVVEYNDSNQHIKVHKMNNSNKLISYTITDKANNTIDILNKYICSDYIGTEIELNGHKTSIKDMSYVDNIMLKKPYTSEDDLDFAMSNLAKSNNKIEDVSMCKTQRKNENAITNFIISDKVKQKSQPLPISIRKSMLLKT